MINELHTHLCVVYTVHTVWNAWFNESTYTISVSVNVSVHECVCVCVCVCVCINNACFPATHQTIYG